MVKCMIIQSVWDQEFKEHQVRSVLKVAINYNKPHGRGILKFMV